MIYFRNNYKSSFVLFVLFLISVSSILFLMYDRNKLKTEIVNKQTLLSSFIKDSNDRAKLEGKELYKLFDIPKDTLLYMLKTSGKEFNIFFWVDSIDCYTCFQFHVDQINQFSKLDIPVLTYSTLHSRFLRNNLHKSIGLSQKINNKNKPIGNYNLVILFINNKGKIIYADVADKTNYEKSKIFYHKINSFISHDLFL